jgi:hypothetical protein
MPSVALNGGIRRSPGFDTFRDVLRPLPLFARKVTVTTEEIKRFVGAE